MAGSVQVQVLDRQKVVFKGDFTGMVELGRQSEAREELYRERHLADGVWRVPIAPVNEDTISRQHAHLELLAGNHVRLVNKSTKVPIHLSDGTELAAGKSCEVALPVGLAIGRRTVQLRAPLLESQLRSLRSSVLPPGQQSILASRFPTIDTNNVDLNDVLSWLQTTMGVLNSAASSSDFFQKAAQAVVDIVGCDTGRVLLFKDGRWETAMVRNAPRVTVNLNWNSSDQVLARLLEEKKTFWLSPDTRDEGLSDSLAGLEVVVAAPILDRDGNVLGAIYGDCRADRYGPTKGRITELEARLVELLASGVATGLARLEQEKAAVEAEVRFSQFFTPELASQLAVKKDLLDGRESQVSLLFADIRNFSRLSDHLGAAGTVKLIGDVMGVLSDCVLAHRGVLVDYIGDELIAMWGAPETQPSHATLACRAALDMLGELPKLNIAWRDRLCLPLDLGIGINSGTAWVGNMGSRHKFKYGPLGPVVNLASRVQGATKHLRARMLITEHTHKQLEDGFSTRRVCQVRAVGIEQPVHLFELVVEQTEDWADLKGQYEEALADYEAGEFRKAAQLLGKLLGKYSDDGPALVMCWRVLQTLVEQSGDFDPVWDLPGK
jgi:adenylate cyclase